MLLPQRHLHLHLREDLAKVVENAIDVKLSGSKEDVLARFFNLNNTASAKGTREYFKDEKYLCNGKGVGLVDLSQAIKHLGKFRWLKRFDGDLENRLREML